MAKEGNSAKGHNVHSTNIYLLLYFSSTPPQSPVALTIREQMTRMKTKHEIWCNGSGDRQPLLDWGAESTLSPAFIPNCRLQDFFFILSLPRHYTDRVQISLFLPQAIPFWACLRNNQQVHRQRSSLIPIRCSKVFAFKIPVILPSGSGLGVWNKEIILKKNMKDNH